MDKEWLEDKEKNTKKKTIISAIFVVALLAIVVGISVALFRTNTTSGDNTLNTGRISMSYTEPSNALILENALPMSDEEGKAQTKYFEFTVATHATTNANDDTGITIPYEINISDIETDDGMVTLAEEYVKVNLVTVSGTTETEVLTPKKVITLNPSTLRENATTIYETSDVHKNGSTTKTTTYRLRAWLDESLSVSDSEKTYQYKFRVNVNSTVNAVGVETPTAEGTKYLAGEILNQGVVTTGDGLYMSTETNDGNPTYYYRGAVENNYVGLGVTEGLVCSIKEEYSQYSNLFDYSTMNTSDCETMGYSVCIPTTGDPFQTVTWLSECEGGTLISNVIEIKNTLIPLKWRVLRINEDGTIRLIAPAEYAIQTAFNSNVTELKDIYFSETNVDGGIMKKVNDWYTANLSTYDSLIATSNYCEALDNNSFSCRDDKNGYGLVTNQKIGLITRVEATHAIENGGYLPDVSGGSVWTMTPSDYIWGSGFIWAISNSALNTDQASYDSYRYALPVINLRADVTVTGVGSSTNPWVVQTN